MILPEVMLCCWFIASVYYFKTKQHLLLFLSLTATVWTKETGIVFVLSFLFLLALKLINQKRNINFSSWIAIVGSILMFVLFFILNKLEYGWFLFPEHTNMMESNIDTIVSKAKELYTLIFSNKGNWTFLLPGIPFLYLLLKKQKINLNVLTFTISFLTICLFNNYPKNAVIFFLFYSIMLLSSLVIILQLLGKENTTDKDQTFILLWISINAFILFSALNFLSGRYILIAVPIVILLSLQIIQYLLSNLSNYTYLLLIPIGIATVFQLLENNKIGDTDLGHIQVIKCQQQIAKSIAIVAKEDDIVKVDFILKHHYSNPDIGYYLDNYPKVQFKDTTTFDYYIYHDLIDNSKKEIELLKEHYGFRLVDECNVDHYKIQLYANE
jgi:hypothetical protein